MIRKFLVLGKYVTLAAKPPDESSSNEKSVSFELLLPLSTFWSFEDRLRRIQYLMSIAEEPLVITDQVVTLVRDARQYLMHERDRHTINEKMKNNELYRYYPPGTGPAPVANAQTGGEK